MALAPPALPAGISNLLGLGGDDTAQDRLRDGAYTSPSGTRIKYQFVEVRRTGKLRGTAFQFSGVDGALVQRKGFGARQYPLRCYFSGKNHDLEALAFEAAIYESGIGSLEHPRYGLIPNVVPFGSVTTREDLVTAVNQTILEVTFWTTLVDIYPSGRGDPASEILAALGNFDVVASQEFDANTDLLTAAARASTKSTVKAFLRDVSAALQSVADATTKVRREFDDQVSLINLGIDVLIGQPLLLARQLSDLVRAPSRALAGIQSRLDGYRKLLDDIIASPAGTTGVVTVTQAGLLLKQKNDFAVAHHLAMNAVAGSVSSVLNHTFATKPEALRAADDVTQQFDDLIAWREQGFGDLKQTDTGGAYQQIQESVALTAGFLIETSFTLVPERRIVLDRPRSMIELAAEIYGSVDDRLDLLIRSNKFTGSEMLELPRGREIVYYPS